MFMRYLGFLLLVWFPGALRAQSCDRLTLENGYFVPEPQTSSYDHTELTYACDKGYKPDVRGWWQRVTCQNGKWSHTPKCIDEQACFPPTIPNAKYTESTTGWHENEDIIRIKCDDGYEPKHDRQVTTTCTDGTWSSMPGCKRSDDACGEPPRIPHAVVIQGYQEVFRVDAKVNYECEDGYAAVGNKTIFCISGLWSDPPTCRSVHSCKDAPYVANSRIIQGYDNRFDPDAEVTYECEDGYTVEGGDSRISIYCISGSWNEHPTCSIRTSTDQGGPAGPDEGDVATDDSQPSSAGRGARPGTAQGGATVERTDGRHTSDDGRGDRGSTGQGGRTPTGGRTGPETGTGTRPATGHGGGSSGSTTRPAGGGSSTTSGSDGRDSKPLITRIQHCGAHPVVDNGVLVENESMFLKYQCANFYKLVGSETVTCYSDGTWSPLPVCKEAFCVLRPGQYLGGHLSIPSNKFIAEEQKKIDCKYSSFSASVQCRNGELTFTSRCCSGYYGYCL